ncbi:DapH/DapD/GlmU-related protein [Neisseria yangbaofengii]|uniref:DapH/DapD/GlmU-related protein n=1 Tax=Neisseria yangbaofengii TaxID=2709396 RepID=UPI0013EACD3E|nr:DapH/DapD/GlmU-related protein [Neisseria yangbaofengii]
MKYALSQPAQQGFIPRNSPLFDEIHHIVAENSERLARLNQNYHEPDARRALLGEIIGENVDESVVFNTPLYSDFGRHISLGKNIFINVGVMFTDLGGIVIEDGVQIGPRANLISVNHPLDPAERHGVLLAPVHIKRNAWIGANATVLPGVTVGENAIVAAGAVVNKDVPPNCMVAGVPAKIIKQL